MLAGIRILDLTRLLPGGYATMHLADLGADVVKVEEPRVGDYMRDIAPSGFQLLNRNKRSIGVDLKHDAGRELLLRLASGSDVLIESFRPGVMDRLGLGYQQVAAAQPGIVYCSLSGYGQDGPLRLASGHDLNYQSVSGMLHLTGRPGSEPAPSGAALGDLAGAMFAAMSVLAALVRRQRTGQGEYIDVALTDALVSLGAHYAAEQRAREVDLGTMFERPGYGIFATADGASVSVCAMEDVFWTRLVNTLDPDDPLRGHPDRRRSGLTAQQVNQMLAQSVRRRSAAEWLALAAEHDLPVAPVNDLAGLPEDPHLAARQLFQTVPGPQGRPLSHVRFPAVFGVAGPERFGPAPARGEQTDLVLAEYGLTEAEVAGLRELGALG